MSYERRRQLLQAERGDQILPAYLDRRRWLLRACPRLRSELQSCCAPAVEAPSETESRALPTTGSDEAEMQRKLKEKKLRKQEQAQAKEKRRMKQQQDAEANGIAVAVTGSTIQEQIGNALSVPVEAPVSSAPTELGALEPGSAAAGRVLARAADEASDQANVDEGLYWSMRDFDGGYALYGSRRIFHYKDTPVTMIQFGNGPCWLLAIAMSNFSINVAHVSEASARVVSTCTGHTGQVTALTWSSDNELLCSSSTDRSVMLWANPEFQCVRIIDCGASINSVCWHPTRENLLALCDSMKRTQLIDTHTGAAVEEIEFEDPIRALAWSPSGAMLLFGDEDGHIHCYFYLGDKEIMRKACSERVSGRAITHLQTCGSPVGDDVIVMANSVQNSVKMCRLKIERGDTELELLREFPIVNQSVVIRSCFCPTTTRWPGSHSIVTGSEDNIVYIYNLDKKGEAWCNMLQGHEAPVLGSTWSGDGAILVTCDTDGSVVIWCRDALTE